LDNNELLALFNGKKGSEGRKEGSEGRKEGGEGR
jgi:hypothetical protein